jgi:uncharacterized protein (DUF1810 family)
MNDPFDLNRFVTAQDPVYGDALAILRGGAMCTPYMDFIFPRLAGGSDNKLANPYAIISLDEARAYLEFPLLGNRYRECVEALSWLGDESAVDVFGQDDAKKLQSSLTLFAEASNEQLLRIMLSVWYDNLIDSSTIERINLTV